MELMGMNETNETELMLVTPLSEAPTPMPPTPAPTPIPQEVSVTVDFALLNATSFDKAAVLKAMNLSPTATVVTTFKVTVTDSVSPIPSQSVAEQTYTIVFNLVGAQLTVTITPIVGDGRRLASGATIKAEAQSSDATAVDAASARAADTSTLTAALKTVDSVKFQNVVTSQVTAPQTQAAFTVTDSAADGDAASALATSLEESISTNKDQIQTAAGATETVVETPQVVQQPTPMPTKMPTFMPTMLPQGASFAPTRMLTYMPTKMPTATPTYMPTSMPTNMPTKVPTSMPTNMPTKMPTNMPTNEPTKMPTAMRTTMPTKMPTAAPTPVPRDNHVADERD